MLDKIKEKMREREESLPLPALSALERAYLFAMVKVFGRLAYKPRYLKGRYFQHFWSVGWRWAYNGMFAKLFKGAGRGVPWPVSSQGSVSPDVEFFVDDLNNFQGNTYFQAFNGGRITLGRGVWIARGCSLITSNHDPVNPDEHLPPQDIVLGDHCWLGANVTVLPGVTLGPHTVVAANAAVTKSFPEGNCIIGGVPARLIRKLDSK